MILAGKTNVPVNTYVRVTTSDDPDVEGLEGRITHPFPGLMTPGVEYIAGLQLNDANVFSGGICNLTDEDTFEVVYNMNSDVTSYERTIYSLDEMFIMSLLSGNGTSVDEAVKAVADLLTKKLETDSIMTKYIHAHPVENMMAIDNDKDPLVYLDTNAASYEDE